MNKKHIILSSIVMSLFVLIAFLSVALSWFFLSSSTHEKSVETNGNAIEASLRSKNDYYEEMLRFVDLSNFEITYFPEGSLKSSSDSMGKSVVVPSLSYFSDNLNKTYQEKDPLEQRPFTYHLYRMAADKIYVRYGEVVPQNVLISRNFLIIGSAVVVVGDLLYIIFTMKQLERSMNSLKIQVQKLQGVGGLPSQVVYHDDLEFYSKIIRDSRKELERQLSEAKSKAAQTDFILDSFIEGMIVIDQEFNIIVFNEKAAEILGIEKDDALHRNFRIIKEPTIVKNLSVVANTGIRSAYDLKRDTRVYHCEIEPIHFEVAGSIKQGAALLLLDVTDEYNSAAMKRDFFTNASHELKSPLTSILGYQEMIEQGVITSPEELASANEKTVAEAKRMNKIIMEMLTLSSLENENLRPVEKINVSRGVDELLSLHQAEIEKKKIVVSKEKTNFFIMINADDFSKLFDNIITNAIKYNKPGGLIEIKIDEVKRQVSIRDTGIGIAKEDQSRVFERFYRVDKARSRAEMGTGLGLAIVKYVCSYYGITIDLQSVLGEGSTFVLTFPEIKDQQ